MEGGIKRAIEGWIERGIQGVIKIYFCLAGFDPATGPYISAK